MFLPQTSRVVTSDEGSDDWDLISGYSSSSESSCADDVSILSSKTDYESNVIEESDNESLLKLPMRRKNVLFDLEKNQKFQ